MREAFLLLALVMTAGCLDGSGPAPPGPAADDGPVAVPADTGARWTLTGCDHMLVESRLPAALAQELLPPGTSPSQFPPGISYVNILVTACAAATLADGTVLADPREALLTVGIRSDADMGQYVLAWLASPPQYAAALRGQGFAVEDGGFEDAAATLPGGQRIAIGTAQAGVAEVECVGGRAAEPGTTVQDRVQLGDTAEARVRVELPRDYIGDFQDACLVQAEAPAWQAAYKAAAREAQPFRMAGIDIGYAFPAPLRPA